MAKEETGHEYFSDTPDVALVNAAFANVPGKFVKVTRSQRCSMSAERTFMLK